MAGALVIITNRSVLSGGVMTALALIPATSIIGIGVVASHWTVAGKALIRLLVEIGIVVFGTDIIFTWKKYTVKNV